MLSYKTVEPYTLELLKKYPEYSIFRALMSMTYFEDAENQITPKMFVDVTWKEIKDFLKQTITQASLSNQPE